MVAATSEAGCVVTNGMSQYSRAEFNANAGIVVGITPADYPGDALAGVAFQREWEQRAFAAGGGDYAAPGQLVGRSSGRARLGGAGRGRAVLSNRRVRPPTWPRVCLASRSRRCARRCVHFDRDIAGFAMHDAVLTGVETRTSSPIRIVRGGDGHSVNTPGLFPAGEGAGYAGGIMSAGVDGIRVAEAVAASMTGCALPERMRRGDTAVAYG